MDQHTDSDFLKLSNQVRKGFEANSEEHQSIMKIAVANTARIDQNERAISAMNRLCIENEKSNAMLQRITIGSPDGKVVGYGEQLRTQEKFLASIRRGAWYAVGALVAAAIAWIVQVFNHVAVN